MNLAIRLLRKNTKIIVSNKIKEAKEKTPLEVQRSILQVFIQ